MDTPYTPRADDPGEPVPQPWFGSPPPPGNTPPPASVSGTSQDRDRLVVHLVWEGVLLLGVIALLVVAVVMTGGAGLTNLLIQAGPIGLIAAGLALSLRTGAPNLAVGSVATVTGVVGAWLVMEAGLAPAVAMTMAVLLATFVGLVTAGLVAILSVPAWLVTLAVALVLQAVVLGITGGMVIALPIGAGGSVLWFWLFVVGSLSAGVLLLPPAVRRWLVPDRAAGRVGRWEPPTIGMIVGLTGSSLLAALAGVAQVMRLQAAASETDVGFVLTMTALAAVLIGGTSIFGRRAGVAGTVLGVLAVASGQFVIFVDGSDAWVRFVFVGTMLLVGLAVNRLIETLAGR